MSIIIIFLALVGFIFGTLVFNQANLFHPPGIKARLGIFFTSHVAEISADPVLPELTAPVFHETPETLYRRAVEQAENLDWQIIELQPEALHFKAEVSTPVWRFKDDISVTIVEQEIGSSIRARSESRVGRGDLGANAKHLQQLLSALQQIDE